MYSCLVLTVDTDIDRRADKRAAQQIMIGDKNEKAEVGPLCLRVNRTGKHRSDE